MPTPLAGFSFSSISSLRRSKGQFETYEPHPSHRRMIKALIIVIVLGGAFLLFWQTVLQYAFLPSEWNEELCVRLFTQYQSDVTVDSFAQASAPGEEVQKLDASFFGETESKIFSIEKLGERVRSCRVLLTTNNNLGGYGDAYACGITTIRYRSEETQAFLLAGSQVEFPEELAQAGLLRYNYEITYYNPDARADYEAALSSLQQHECSQV